MLDMRMRLVVAVAAGSLALTGCTSSGATGGAAKAPNGTPTSTSTSTQKAAPTPSASNAPGSKEAWGDVKLGALHIDGKLGTPSADVTITNHTTKRSNYIVDVNITFADGKTRLDSTMVSSPGLAPGQTAKEVAHFQTTQKLPTGATLTLVGVARMVA